MSQEITTRPDARGRGAMRNYGIYAGILVLIAGPILQIATGGADQLGRPNFWFGLYGWLAAAIIVGAIVSFVQARVAPEAAVTPEPGASAALPVGASVAAGELPAWEVAELPAPPRFGLAAALALIGPGAILLGTSIGSGEWLIGPAVTARFGGALLWIATASVILQVIMNMEFVRYTMYTGEPVYTGFMRTKPGSTFWSWVYAILAFLQLGWPGWALSSATAIAAAFLSRLPGDQDATLVKWI